MAQKITKGLTKLQHIVNNTFFELMLQTEKKVSFPQNHENFSR